MYAGFDVIRCFMRSVINLRFVIVAQAAVLFEPEIIIRLDQNKETWKHLDLQRDGASPLAGNDKSGAWPRQL